ncbi:hypothetical protein SH2C18_12500 [Clostridium sediminicola]|uniref:hypothetical protein n=1 Tax=Clostridium sediminicola TaxID=3114879 RepID=UPI0031F26DE1
MKVRIKLKNLIFVIIICVISIALLIPHVIYKRAEMISEKDPITANLFYEKYIKLIPFGKNRAKALYSIAENIAPYEKLVAFNSFHSFGSGSTGIPLNKQALELGEKYYWEIINKYENEEYASNAYKKLVDTKIALCDIKNVDKLITQGKDSSNDDINRLAKKYELLNLIVRKEYNRAEKGCFKLLENNSTDTDIYRMLRDIYYFQGNFNESKKYIKKSQEGNTNNNVSIYPVLSGESSSNYFDEKNSIDFAEDFYNGNSTIKGKVKNIDKGIPYVIVELKDSRKDSLNEWSSLVDGKFVYTDENGDFEFNNLSKGEYSIEVRVPSLFFVDNEVNVSKTIFDDGWVNIDVDETKELDVSFNSVINVTQPKGIVEDLNEEVEVKWLSYPEASYYKVEIISFDDPVNLTGSRFQSPISDKIYTNEYKISMNEIKNTNTGFSTDGDGIISPQAYFGYTYPGSILPLVITAYNDKDKQISTSLPLITNFKDISAIKINDENILNADKLVLEGKVKEAKEEYEEYLEDNPDDTRVLTILTKIYDIGYRWDREKHAYIGQDKVKMIQMAEKVYKLTNEPSIFKTIYDGIYRDLDKKDELIWAKDKINKLPEEIKDASIYITLANIEIKLGDFEKANQYFNKAKEKDNFYISDDNIITKLYLKEYQEALNLVTREDYKIYYNGNKVNLIQYLKNIINKTFNANEENAFVSIMKSLLVNSRLSENEDFKKEYNTLKYNIKDDDMLNLLKELERILYIG